MTTYGYEPDTEAAGGHRVQLVSGEDLQVMTEVEARWFTANREKYLAETKFTDTTDLQDMDRLLCLELLIFRWNQHLALGRDYDGNLIDEDLIRKQVKDQSEAITRLKTSLGLDKKSRDAALNEGNFAAWLADVKRRARIFGIHRETQLQKALVLMNELSSIIDSFERSDEEERSKLGFSSYEDIVGWVKNTMVPEYKALDEHFLQNEQRYWTRDM
jgi:hypothetical protein